MSDSHRFADGKLQEFYEDFVECKEQTQRDRECLLAALEQNTAAIKAQSQATQDLITAWNAAQGFVKVMAAIASVAKALIPIGLVLAALWYFLKTGHWTKGPQ